MHPVILDTCLRMATVMVFAGLLFLTVVLAFPSPLATAVAVVLAILTKANKLNIVLDSIYMGLLKITRL